MPWRSRWSGATFQEHADVEGRLDGEIELIGGELEDDSPLPRHRRQIERRRPQIAADADVAGTAGVKQVTDQRRGRRLAVGAGDGDVAGLRQHAPQELDIAHHLDAGVMRGSDHRVRKRHAGARHQGRDPVLIASGAHLEALIARRRPRIRHIVPAEHARAAGTECPRRGEAGAREPEHGDRAIAIERDPDHWLTSASASRARSGRGSRRSPRSG